MRVPWNHAWAIVGSFLAYGCGEGATSPPSEKTCPSSDASFDGGGQRLTALALGTGKACAIADDGALLCWGDLVRTPEPVPGVDRATAVVIGSPDTCAIRPGGSVVCWSEYEEPAVVPDLCEATALAVTTGTHCAVVDGSVRCWGALNEGIFGKSSSRTPVSVPGVTEATAVAAGRAGYTCALIVDGSVTCWGGGPRTSERPGFEPAPVPEISDAVALYGSDTQGLCALLADGSVTCWSHAAAPTPVPSIEGVVSFAHSLSHACAVLEDGSVSCWGRNQTGQLGNGTEENSDSPVTVEGLSGATAVLAHALDSSMGYSCALLDDGTARCWGSNFHGQLGDGMTADSSTPVEVQFP